MGCRFYMNGDHRRSCIAKSLQVAIRLRYHQMAVQRQLGRSPGRLHNHWPKRDIWNEMAVHDIYMDYTSATALYCLDLLAQARKVRRQDWRGNFDHFSRRFFQ